VIVAQSVKTSDGREIAGVLAKVPAATPAPRGQAVAITAGQLAATPENYIGRKVTVRAEIEDVYNPQLFTLDEDRMFVGPDVIVYAKNGRTSLTEEQEDQTVTVTGEVRKFVDSELFGTATWFDPWFNDLDATGRGLVRSRPVIIADSITSSQGAELYAASTTRRAAAGANSTEAVGTSGRAAGKAGGAARSTGQGTTITGCVYRERDVPGRTPNVAERAGVLEDYILAELGTQGTGSATGDSSSGTAGTTGGAAASESARPMGKKMYKLEFVDDEKLQKLVGKRVEVTGRADAEKTDARAAGAPAGTDRSVGPDRIELPEFEVTSIREVPGTCPATPKNQ